MKVLKNLFVSIKAGTETIVGKLENHEAVANIMIYGMKKSIT